MVRLWLGPLCVRLESNTQKSEFSTSASQPLSGVNGPALQVRPMVPAAEPLVNVLVR